MRILDRATTRLPRPWRTVADWLLTIALAIGFVLAFQAEVAKPFRIPSASMEPTLHCSGQRGCEAGFSDRVIACRICYRVRSPHRNDIVVFTPPARAREKGCPGGTFVKRLIALPGETWAERNGYVYIDGKRLNEPYVKPDLRDHFTYSPQRIPQGRYFVMGDNRSASCDSRAWGTVPRGNLIGPVVATYWPLNRISLF
ncbi:MAG: signal peptidase I [Gaiellaceae bacterium]